MEYIKIDDEKALLSLSAEDMEKFRDKRPNSIRRIMAAAHERYGADTLDGRLFVQMYESKGGGCELFVTKLRERRDMMTSQSRMNEIMIPSARGYMFRETRAVYEFDELEKMLLCCKMLDGSGYVGRSESYADRERGKYYLVLDGESSYPAETMGERRHPSVVNYLKEHCTKLFGEHSAGLLGRLAQ